MSLVERLRVAGELGGRTVQIVETGGVECTVYEPGPLTEGWVRIRTVTSAISPGTEMTFYGRSNVYLHRRWNADLRIFEEGEPSLEYPVVFGYRAAGEVVESADPRVQTGARVWGNWRHTEYVAMPAERAMVQRIPAELSWDDAVDIGQLAPICINAAAFGERDFVGEPAVVFGAGPVGLVTAQVLRAEGAGRVYVVDLVPSRLEIVADLGLEPVDGAGDVAAELKRRHGADGVPVVWECSGAVPALQAAIRVVRRLGTVVAVGFYQGEPHGLRLGDEFHHNGVRLVSGQIGNPHPSRDRTALSARALELALGGLLTLGGLPRTRFPVEDAALAFEALRHTDRVLQTVLDYR